MKVFALTLLSLVALSQARSDYRLQCTRDEIGIRWPSYFSNSEYFVCQSVFGSQLTVHCPPGEIFTFVLQQCTSPSLYVPSPPMTMLPTAAPITMHLVEEAPIIIGQAVHSTHEHGLDAAHQGHLDYSEHNGLDKEQQVIHAMPLDPTPPTDSATPPTLVAAAPPKPGKKPGVPQPQKGTAPKKPSAPTPGKAAAKKPAGPATPPKAAAKKPAGPAQPPKAAKKPTPPSKAQ
ncbi:GH22087 [Drosophila grimshawi]|uniref:GH22087 n=1 Tax=Drosophila grimshawi TaxID=7222 RepID=B4JS77_DROGR|nr:GH22087 [Drosophila grimshawi]